MYARLLLLAATLVCCLRTNVPTKPQQSLQNSYYGVQATPNVALQQAASKLNVPRQPQVTAYVDKPPSSNPSPPVLVTAPLAGGDAAETNPLLLSDETDIKARFSMSSGCNSASLPWFNISAYERWRPPVTPNGWIDVYVMPYVRRVDDVVSVGE